MKHYFICCLLLILGNVSFAQNTPEDIILEFFETYEEKGIVQGIDYLFATNKWMELKKEAIDNLKEQAHEFLAEDMLGKYYGYELITKKTVGNRLVYASYLIRYDRQPQRFEFTLYKPNNRWRIQNFSFDPRITEELEESGRVFRVIGGN